jgi:hypothetical protein
MMKRIPILLILLLDTFFGFSQTDSMVKLYLNGGKLNADRIDSLNTKEFAFRFELTGQLQDTIKLYLVHHKEKAPFSQIIYKFSSDPLEFETVKNPQIKPGDNLSFTFYIGGQKIVKSYVIGSTLDQLKKPYYLDIYFLYNKDTVDADSFVIPIQLKKQKRKNYVRVEFDDPKQLPKNLSIQFNKQSLTYEVYFPKGQLFHGRMVLEYIDKKKLRAHHGFLKSIATTDLDIGRDFTYIHRIIF